jgi:CRP-like cAMP-binding protein
MASCSVPADLATFLEQRCEKARKAKSTVLFRRGEKAFGVFLVLSGRVSLDDRPVTRSYGAGALVGLPATLAGRNYSMTATVMEDAELGFLPSTVLNSLMQKNPALCQTLLTVLSERMLEIQQVQNTLLQRPKPIPWLHQITMLVKRDFPRLPLQRRWVTRMPSVLGEWVAPMIAWLTVLLMSMAVVGFLLGER